MSDFSPKLGLPFLMPSQAQKHVTVNESLRALDALVQLAVLSAAVATPPESPAGGDGYIVPEGAGEVWAGQDGKVAVWQDGAWAFFSPLAGWCCWVADEGAARVFDGAAWTDPMSTLVSLGINATADETNRFAVSAPASLFTHEGSSHRLAVNRAGGSDTASVLFQSGYSGRAEIGLAGDEDLSMGVSPDGAAFRTVLRAAPDDAAVFLPSNLCFSANRLNADTYYAEGERIDLSVRCDARGEYDAGPKEYAASYDCNCLVMLSLLVRDVTGGVGCALRVMRLRGATETKILEAVVTSYTQQSQVSAMTLSDIQAGDKVYLEAHLLGGATACRLWGAELIMLHTGN